MRDAGQGECPTVAAGRGKLGVQTIKLREARRVVAERR